MSPVFRLLLLLLPLPALAQWDTNVWVGAPERYYLDASTNKVYVKDVFIQDSTNALAERAAVSGISFTPASGFFRTHRAHLKAAKAWINANADEFVDLTNTNASGVLTNEMTLVATDWSPADLLSHVGAPSNYLTSTPWRKLTDPATSNGWHYIDDIVNELVWYEGGITADQGDYYTNTTVTTDWESTWTAAVASATTLFAAASPTTNSTAGGELLARALGQVSGSNFRLILNRGQLSIKAQTIPTNYHSQVDFYITTGANSGWEHDDNGDLTGDLIPGYASFIGTGADTNTATRYHPIGDVTDQPTEPATAPTTGTDTTRGYSQQSDYAIAVAKFNATTNGFSYVAP